MIKDLSNEMRQFLKDIQENIKNQDEVDYLLQRTEKLYNVIFKSVEDLMDYKEEEIQQIEDKQKMHEEKIDEMAQKMKELCRDIYEDEYADFEIVCPYCNYHFDADIDETRNEIVCPECTNVIELDWDEDE